MAKREAVEVTLSEPVQFGEESITSLTLQPMRGRHMRYLPAKPDMGDMMDLAGRLCGQPATVMDDLAADDLVKVLEVVGNFMPAGLATGDE